MSREGERLGGLPDGKASESQQSDLLGQIMDLVPSFHMGPSGLGWWACSILAMSRSGAEPGPPQQ